MILFEKHGIEEKEFSRLITMKNNQFPPHFHRAYEMIYVDEGRLSLSIDQKEYIVGKNDFAFIFNNQMHEFKTIDYSSLNILIFSPELIGDFHMKYKGYVPENNILHLDKKINFKKLDSIYKKKSFIYYMCDKLINQTSFAKIEQSPQTKVLYKILLFVDKNYSETCTLKTISEYLNYDYAYLSKLFLNIMKMTFTDYLNNYRISQACYLLRNTRKLIGEIAISCGYNSLRTFHRNFKKIVGYSPEKYREAS